MTFVVLNTTSSVVTIQDLGQRILGSEEIDLLPLHNFDIIAASVDLATLFAAGTLQRLDGAGGSPVALGQEFNDSVQTHTHQTSAITDFDSGVGLSTSVTANTAHRNINGNAHNMTPAQLGAAESVHTHVGADVTDLAAVATSGDHADLTNSGSNTHAQIDAHVGSTANPHGVSIAQIGAAAASHTHLVADITDFAAGVAANETNTNLQIVANQLEYTREDGTTQTIDLSVFLDDTNAARIVSGVVNPTTGICTFTRDDSTTFTVDFSAFNDQAFANAAAAAAVTAHEAAPDPHPQYTTVAEVTALAPVQSVNGDVGAVVLDSDDIAEGSTNLYYTDSRVALAPAVVANTAKVSADGSVDTHSDVDVTTDPPDVGDVLSWDGANFVPQPGGNAPDAEAFSGYDSSGTTVIGTSWTDIPLGGEHLKTAGFTHVSNAAEITIANNGRYAIDGRVTLRQTSNVRTDFDVRLMVDRGGGYIEEPGTFGSGYSRLGAQGEDTANFSLALDLDAGDKIKMQAIRDDGGGSMFTEANGSGLRIMTIGAGNQGAGSGPSIEKINAMNIEVGGSASNAADQVFDVNLTGYGFTVGQVARIGCAYARGDLSGGTETLDVGFDSPTNPKLTVADDNGADDDVFRAFHVLINQTANVIDIGSGVPGIRVYVSPSAGVNFSPAGMPNGWWWQLAVDVTH